MDEAVSSDEPVIADACEGRPQMLLILNACRCHGIQPALQHRLHHLLSCMGQNGEPSPGVLHRDAPAHHRKVHHRIPRRKALYDQSVEVQSGMQQHVLTDG
nr:hypothetical protein [Nesterenkonia sp. NBAIMH1]